MLKVVDEPMEEIYYILFFSLSMFELLYSQLCIIYYYVYVNLFTHILNMYTL